MNRTVRVSSYFDCYQVDEVENIYKFDPMWRQNALSCRLLLILQQMFEFNVTFIVKHLSDHVTDEKGFNVYPHVNDSVDIYVKPMAITGELLDLARPIEAVFTWRFGFILRRKHSAIMRPYYSLPFAKSVWVCILNITILVTVVLYIMRRWESRIFDVPDCNFLYEVFIVVGVIYQHFLPIPSFLWSRRIAYFCYITFAYVTHSFYTSNLLSYLVTDKEGRMDLKALVESDYELRILENMKAATDRRVNYLERKINVIEKELARSKVIDISAGLEAVRTSKTALLCDYPTVQSFIARTFENEAICELEEVDIFSNVKMYFFAAKGFKDIEKLKIGLFESTAEHRPPPWTATKYDPEPPA
ncbi:unnamed protein product, partial [Iphiclides podalirius]